MVIDFKQENERRFWEWAAEWLEIPQGETFEISFVIAFLVTNGGFTIDEIRAELKNRKIILPEQTYDAVLLWSGADLKQEGE